VPWLDRVGTIVVGCFDGEGSIDELSADLSEAFGAEQEVVRNDVIELVRQVGRAGLLEGVAEEQPQMVAPAMPEGVEKGTPVSLFDLPSVDGDRVALEDLLGRRLLLVNWSPACGYCRRIAPDLEELRPKLAREGVELILLASGTPEDNRDLAREHGLEARILLQEEGPIELFAGMGTPVAYLVDEEGRTASELALGAEPVPELARSLVGR
jgi:peroxiredoxin